MAVLLPALGFVCGGAETAASDPLESVVSTNVDWSWRSEKPTATDTSAQRDAEWLRSFEWSLGEFQPGRTNVQTGTAVGSGVTIEAYEKLVRENLQLRSRLDQELRANDALKRENAALVIKAEELEQKRQNLAASLKDLKAPEELQKELDRLREEKTQLEAEAAKLKQDLDSVQAAAAAPAGAAVSKGSDLLRRLEKENAELRNHIARMQQAEREATKAKEQIADKGARLETDMERIVREKREMEQEVAELKIAEQKKLEAMRVLAKQASRYKADADRLRAQQGKLRDISVKPVGRSDGRHAVLGTEAPAQAVSQSEARPALSDDTRAKRDALVNKAVEFTRQGRYTDAERAYLLALRLDQADADAHYNLGVLYSDYLRNPREAVAHYRAYLDLNPSASDADLVRGWIFDLETRPAGR
ncbi:MAG: tetratricopeptide repeat protein [candidate division WOR-3 bacterium]